jgi:hypothetical protein
MTVNSYIQAAMFDLLALMNVFMRQSTEDDRGHVFLDYHRLRMAFLELVWTFDKVMTGDPDEASFVMNTFASFEKDLSRNNNLYDGDITLLKTYAVWIMFVYKLKNGSDAQYLLTLLDEHKGFVLCETLPMHKMELLPCNCKPDGFTHFVETWHTLLDDERFNDVVSSTMMGNNILMSSVRGMISRVMSASSRDEAVYKSRAIVLEFIKKSPCADRDSWSRIYKIPYFVKQLNKGMKLIQ